jgi:uncharacterized protein YabN with tetrapyrrole methylase and pyrophosphatase domain
MRRAGDLLFQVYFFARVAESRGCTILGKRGAGIRTKLIRRHPQFFGMLLLITPEQGA